LDPQATTSGGGFVRKYNSAGGVDWTKQIIGGLNDFVNGLAADTTGVYVAGSTDGELAGQSSSGGTDAFVLKFDSLGALTWTRQFGSGSSDDAFGVAAVAPDNVFVVATSLGVNPTVYLDHDIVVAQFRVSAPDPTVAGRNYDPLTITGTAGDDLIVLDPGTLTNSIRVTINGAEFGTFQYPHEITFLGGLGDDTIIVNTLAGSSALLDGQEGSDVYIMNLQDVRGLLRITDSGSAGDDRQIVNATAVDDYVDKRGNEIKWWLRGNSPESNPSDPPTPRATITSTGVEKTTIQLGDGNDFILDPGEDTELIGGPGDDTFVITETTGSGIRIEDRGGATEILLELGGLAGPVTIDVEGSLSPVHVSIVGTDGIDEIAIAENGVTTTAGVIVNFVGIIGQLSINSRDGADTVTLENLGDSFTIYNVVADGSGNLGEVQIIGSPPPQLTVNGQPLPQLSGRVFEDVKNDGLFNDNDAGIAGVLLQLFSVDDAVNPVASTTTDVYGFYNFDSLLPGDYRILAAQPDGFLDGSESTGNLSGMVDNSQDSNTISIRLVAGDIGVNYNFAEIRPSRLQALVWLDFNNDGEVNFGEKAIAGVELRLTGTDDRSQAVDLALMTDGDGIAEFLKLRPGNYSLSETQPANYPDGKDVLGTVNGLPSGEVLIDLFSNLVLTNPGSEGVNYNFAERPPASGAISGGQTAGIGFWQNNNGQNLIKSLNGGPLATQLGNWLAATFPNMYGLGAGVNNLAGKTNAEVAAYFKVLFSRTGSTAAGGGPPKMEAQVLATALAVYVTNATLGGNTATAYNFVVSQYGVGTATFNVGTKGAAFGLTNYSTTTVLNLLLAVNSHSKAGRLYDLDGDGDADDSLETSFRTLAHDLFKDINEF
jgi:SdrD B-like domain/Beta-propeller repeat